MRYFFIRSQLIFVSVILLATFVLMMALVMHTNWRWDFTKEKVYSLPEPAQKLLEELASEPIEVLAFYAHDDPVRANFEMFLKECRLRHPRFKYDFYDPDRVPSLAKKFHVKDLYTVILRSGPHEERIVQPTEESLTNAFLRLANPKKFHLCFVTGHGEGPLGGEERDGYRFFRRVLDERNYLVHEMILAQEKSDTSCDVIVVAGPHRDLAAEEFDSLKHAFQEGKGILFLIDPMDPGTGVPFQDFMKGFGIVLGLDVIVDKMSRMVGGDFLVPLVNQYMIRHPVTGRFSEPTFFPVARSVQPSTEPLEDLEVTPLAMSGSGSWAETDLPAMEKGEAVFDAASDLAGPVSLAAAVEKKDPEGKLKRGRMIVVGDSDFLTNAYLDLSGNTDIALNMLQWLSKDDRFIAILPRHPAFQPLLLTQRQRLITLVTTIAAFPAFFLLTGALGVWGHRRSE